MTNIVEILTTQKRFKRESTHEKVHDDGNNHNDVNK